MCVISEDTHARPLPEAHVARPVHSHSFFWHSLVCLQSLNHGSKNFSSVKYFPFENDA